DKAQALFDNCFKVLDGPDAPELLAQELNKTLLIYLKNLKSSNNPTEEYKEEDVTITALNNDSTHYDAYYRFQGYQIFQLANDEVSLSELDNPDKARIVAQCDLKDSIESLVNFYYDDNLGGNIPIMKVEAENKGIRHTFEITEDAFATGDKRLINNKKYYYTAIAYAHNNFKKYTQDPAGNGGLDGQKVRYLSGRKSAIGPIKIHTLMPHIPIPEAEGTVVNSDFGSSPMITRLDGRGNGGIDLELTDKSKQDIFNNNQVEKIEYVNNHGPINVKVIDPLNVSSAEYILKFDAVGSVNTANWTLYKDGDLIATSDATIELGNEQLLLDEGLSIQIQQNKGAGDIDLKSNGYISSDIIYKDSSHMWLSGFPDIDAAPDLNYETPSPYNWIRSGTLEDKSKSFHNDYDPAPSGGDLTWVDPNESFEKLIGGTWAPYKLSSIYVNGPAGTATHKSYKLSILEGVDIILTSDKSKWSRCPVIETGDDTKASEGGVKKLLLRAHNSIDKDGVFATSGSGDDLTDIDAPNYISETSMGWFPGYAISVETGERLNVMYGESSWLVGENGRDMQFNPTSKFMTFLGGVDGVLMGGKHFLYIFRHSPDNNGCPAYDAGKWLRDKMDGNPNNIKLLQVHRDIMWVTIPMANPNEKWLDNDAWIRLRVNYPYTLETWSEKNSDIVSSRYNGGYPAYSFNTANIATTKMDNATAESALDLINVVPNPYYAFSSYETDQLDNRVRIVNLPERCTISIYSSNGILVRRYKKDEINTYIDWDLKNTANIPIAGGVYYIHIDAPNIGEKTIKWFGILRPVDLNAF
ncbi:MAG: T9SS C-terminal target domain-containing protein, partial [Bacteroidetes bacterium]